MAPAPRHGKGVRPLLDEKDLSPFLRTVTVSGSMDAPEVTTFGDNDREYIPGLRDATFSFDGLHSASTTPVDDITSFLDDALGGSTKHVLTVDVERSTGGRAWLVKADDTSYDVAAPVEDVVSVAVDAQASEGYRGGRMLRPLGTSTSTGSGSAVLTAGTTAAGGTTGGGVAHLHVTAVSSTFGAATFKVQHSTSGSTWADLVTFTAATAATFQRSTVSGTIKEQLRSTISTFTLSTLASSITAAVAFARQTAKT